jgi:hypothetical protein
VLLGAEQVSENPGAWGLNDGTLSVQGLAGACDMESLTRRGIDLAGMAAAVTATCPARIAAMAGPPPG